MRITIADLAAAKRENRKITAVSCYDYTTAKMVAAANVQMILVGDSAAQFVLGFESTLPATMDFMVALTGAVRRGAPEACLVADMPFLSYQAGIGEAVKNAGRFFTDGVAQIVKIEVTEAYLDVVKAVSDAGMPVMAHIGIRPQAIAKLGKLKVEGTTAELGLELISLAEKMTYAGASSLLLEGMAAEVAEIITKRVDVPVIGCGSGPGCDGQILIAPDILGLTSGVSPKFAKSYGDLGTVAKSAFEKYAKEVVGGKYPDDAHSYHMKNGEFGRLKEMLDS